MKRITTLFILYFCSFILFAPVVSADWTKVKDLQVGQQIRTVDGWEKIKSIETLPPEQVWDLSILGTHNFVGNNIVAHNTSVKPVIKVKSNSTTIIEIASGVLSILAVLSGGIYSFLSQQAVTTPTPTSTPTPTITPTPKPVSAVDLISPMGFIGGNFLRIINNVFNSGGDKEQVISGEVKDPATELDKLETNPNLLPANVVTPTNPQATWESDYKCPVFIGGPIDPQAPKLTNLIDGIPTPGYRNLMQVSGIDNAAISNGATPVGVSMVELDVPGNKNVYVPKRDQTIGYGAVAMVTYVCPDRSCITLNYYDGDNARGGYTISLKDIVVNEQIANEYEKDNNGNRINLPYLFTNQLLGKTLDSTGPKLIIRDKTEYMDPRSCKDWWGCK